MCDTRKCSIVIRFSKFSLGMYVFVNLFRIILPAVPTECDVLIVCRQHNDKGWKFKEQHPKCGKILRGRKDTLAAVVSTLRGERPRRPLHSDASVSMHLARSRPLDYESSAGRGKNCPHNRKLWWWQWQHETVITRRHMMTVDRLLALRTAA